MFKCNVMVGVRLKIHGMIRPRKIRVEQELTDVYRSTGRVPNEGYILPSGDLVIEKGSDADSIILFIKPKPKQDEPPVCQALRKRRYDKQSD